jgi:DNA-binding MarR family transcriptional regulator
VNSLFDICERQHGGNAESAAAFRKTAPTLRERQVTVLEMIRAAGGTGLSAKEIAARLGVGLHTLSPRCSELKALGLIVPQGSRRDGSAVLVATLESDG